MHHTFLYISLPLLHDYDVKMPKFTFYGGHKQAPTKFSFGVFLNLSAVPKKSNPGKFAYIRHFQRIGINATKSEKTLIASKVTFSSPSPSPSSMLKLPSNRSENVPKPVP